VADVVGVIPNKTIYTSTGPIVVPPHSDLGPTVVEEEKEKEDQDYHVASKHFWGAHEVKHVVKKGEPIPGYTGFNRRVVADNVFGATYAHSRKKGDESLNNITKEKQQNLQKQAGQIPPIKK